MEEDAVALKTWFRHWPQHLAAFLAAQSTTCAGVVVGWTSPMLPALQSNCTASLGLIPLSEEQGSWVAALMPLGALLGAIAGGFLADIFGRRCSILATALPFAVGALLTLVPQPVILLYFSRFISGLGVGIATTIVPMYSEEIAEPKLRGALGVYLEATLNIGILWSYTVGFVVPYVWFAATSCLLPIFFFASFFWMPESPVYLMSVAREEEAEEALRWLRAASTQKTTKFAVELLELKAMFLDVKNTRALKKDTTSSWLSKLVKNVSLNRPTSKACFVIFGLIFFQQAGGIDAIIFYTVDILEESGTAVSPFVSGAIAGVIQLLASVVSFLTVDRLGRRILLLTSLISLSLSHFLLSLNSYLRETDIDTEFYSWVPLFAICIYFVAYSLGIGPIVWFMVAELAPTESKETIGSVAISFSWSLAFLVSKFFPSLFHRIGSLTTFAVFSAMCFLGTVFVTLFVPETKGKTKKEIEEYFSKRNKSKQNSAKV